MWSTKATPPPPVGREGGRSAPRTAFVLSGGGNHGVAQVGMLRALLERGIVPDVIVGTSVGALNGAALAADPTLSGIERLALLWQRVRAEHIFPGGRLKRAWALVAGGTHLCPNRGLVALIDRVVPGRSFADLLVALRVVATDLHSGEEVVFASGMLKPALLASTALPGTFPPVVHDGRLLIDGGVVDNVPISHALAGPVERIFVLNVTSSSPVESLRNPVDVVLRAFAISRNQRFEREVESAPPGVEVVLLPRPHDARAPFDFSGPGDIIAQAYTLATAHLETWAAAAALAVPPVPAPHRSRRRLARLRPGALLDDGRGRH